jgi:hypothetical protein
MAGNAGVHTLVIFLIAVYEKHRDHPVSWGRNR